MNNREFSSLLRRAARAAATHQELSAKITEAFEDRYGCTHSAIDADDLIDWLDYGGGGRSYTVAEIDQIMAEGRK